MTVRTQRRSQPNRPHGPNRSARNAVTYPKPLLRREPPLAVSPCCSLRAALPFLQIQLSCSPRRTEPRVPSAHSNCRLVLPWQRWLISQPMNLPAHVTDSSPMCAERCLAKPDPEKVPQILSSRQPAVNPLLRAVRKRSEYGKLLTCLAMWGGDVWPMWPMNNRGFIYPGGRGRPVHRWFH